MTSRRVIPDRRTRGARVCRMHVKCGLLVFCQASPEEVQVRTIGSPMSQELFHGRMPGDIPRFLCR